MSCTERDDSIVPFLRSALNDYVSLPPFTPIGFCPLTHQID
nr:MAG TPA: hypothetical protein [Caudoviricetes sp.]